MIYAVNYEELVTGINPRAAVRYLESLGWQVFPRKNKAIRVLQKNTTNGAQVTIPYDRSLADYQEAMLRAVQVIADTENMTLVQVILSFLNPNIDIMKRRPARKNVESSNTFFNGATDYSQPLGAFISTMKRKQAKQVTILGRIQRLESSQDPATRRDGVITVAFLDKDNKSRRMVVTLEKDAYEEAVRAHLDGKYVEISGNMDTKSSRAKMNGLVFNVLD